MKLNEIKAAPGFENLIRPLSAAYQDEREANLIMFKFLSEIENVANAKKISRKKLAELIGTSASNITQLFRGGRLINLLTLAKFERVLEIEFDITTAKKIEEKKTEIKASAVSHYVPIDLSAILNKSSIDSTQIKTTTRITFNNIPLKAETVHEY